MDTRSRTPLAAKPVRLKKGLGQHLLASGSAARRIVHALEASPGDLVVEIGPGLGALTGVLLENRLSVVAVERDDEMADELERRFLGRGAPSLEPAGLEIVRADILGVSLDEIARRHGIDRLFVIGNIPYRITSPLLFWLVAQMARVRGCVLTIQREVAERLLAGPGEKAYGALTLAIARRAEVKRVMHLSPGAFRPPPKVRSTVVRLIPRTEPAVSVPDEELLELIIRKSFNQRRKMLRTSLLSEAPWDARAVGIAATRAGIALTRRPEELSLAEFGRLATALSELGYGVEARRNGGELPC